MIENQSDNIDNKDNDISEQENCSEDASSTEDLVNKNDESSPQKKEEIQNTQNEKPPCLNVGRVPVSGKKSACSAISDYLHLDYISLNKTLINKIYKVQPGEYLEYNNNKLVSKF